MTQVTRRTGNQHHGRRWMLMEYLHIAREYLKRGYVASAQFLLREYRAEYDKAPASTRRRWKCGR